MNVLHVVCALILGVVLLLLFHCRTLKRLPTAAYQAYKGGLKALTGPLSSSSSSSSSSTSLVCVQSSDITPFENALASLKSITDQYALIQNTIADGSLKQAFESALSAFNATLSTVYDASAKKVIAPVCNQVCGTNATYQPNTNACSCNTGFQATPIDGSGGTAFLCTNVQPSLDTMTSALNAFNALWSNAPVRTATVPGKFNTPTSCLIASKSATDVNSIVSQFNSATAAANSSILAGNSTPAQSALFTQLNTQWTDAVAKYLNADGSIKVPTCTSTNVCLPGALLSADGSSCACNTAGGFILGTDASGLAICTNGQQFLDAMAAARDTLMTFFAIPPPQPSPTNAVRPGFTGCIRANKTPSEAVAVFNAYQTALSGANNAMQAGLLSAAQIDALVQLNSSWSMIWNGSFNPDGTPKGIPYCTTASVCQTGAILSADGKVCSCDTSNGYTTALDRNGNALCTTIGSQTTALNNLTAQLNALIKGFPSGPLKVIQQRPYATPGAQPNIPPWYGTVFMQGLSWSPCCGNPGGTHFDFVIPQGFLIVGFECMTGLWMNMLTAVYVAPIATWPNVKADGTSNTSVIQRLNVLNSSAFNPPNFATSASGVGGPIGNVVTAPHWGLHIFLVGAPTKPYFLTSSNTSTDARTGSVDTRQDIRSIRYSNGVAYVPPAGTGGPWATQYVPTTAGQPWAAGSGMPVYIHGTNGVSGYALSSFFTMFSGSGTNDYITGLLTSWKAYRALAAPSGSSFPTEVCDMAGSYGAGSAVVGSLTPNGSGALGSYLDVTGKPYGSMVGQQPTFPTNTFIVGLGGNITNGFVGNINSVYLSQVVTP